jgi:hypothetical protein
MKVSTIRYGIFKRRPESKSKNDFIHENHSLTISDYDFDSDESHRKIIDTIYKKHQGWMIHGYCVEKYES